MDLIDRVKDIVNSTDPKIKMAKGAINTASGKDSLVIYPLPGSNVSQNYMDGSKDVNINLEIAMASKDGNLLEETLWQIQDELDAIETIESNNDSFSFNQLEITSKPFINSLNEQGWLVFMVDLKINVTTKEDKKAWHKN